MKTAHILLVLMVAVAGAIALAMMIGTPRAPAPGTVATLNPAPPEAIAEPQAPLPSSASLPASPPAEPSPVVAVPPPPPPPVIAPPPTRREPAPAAPSASPAPNKPASPAAGGGKKERTPAREALSYVGADPAAEAVWNDAINDPTTPPETRKDLIEDLNEDGFVDPAHPSVDDLPLIESRIALIEQLAPDAMDAVNLAAFAEAYKDLVNMYVKASH